MVALQRAIHSPTNWGGGVKETERKEKVETTKAERAKERQLKREEEEERLTKGRREAGEEDEGGRGRGFS